LVLAIHAVSKLWLQANSTEVNPDTAHPVIVDMYYRLALNFRRFPRRSMHARCDHPRTNARSLLGAGRAAALIGVFAMSWAKFILI